MSTPITLVYEDANIVVTQQAPAEFRAQVDFTNPDKHSLVIYSNTYRKVVQKAKELIDDLEG